MEQFLTSKCLITVSCLVKGDNPYENTFYIDIDTNKIKSIGQLKDVIKDKKKFTNQFKLWKVKTPINEEKLKLLNKSYDEIGIKEELGGLEMSSLSKITDHFSDKSFQIIIEPYTSADALSQEILELKKKLSMLENKIIHRNQLPINYLQLAFNNGIIKEGSTVQYGTTIVKVSIDKNKQAALFYDDKHYDSFYKFIFAINHEV